MKTLVIHPKDASTDFLSRIYQGKNWNVVTDYVSNDDLIDLIDEHDRIIMLGHGYQGGLYGHHRIMINASHVSKIASKELVAVWCHANAFFDQHALPGFYTGMIISEPAEAEFYGVPYTQSEIDESNHLLAETIRETIFDENMLSKTRYHYDTTSNRIIKYNKRNLYKAHNLCHN
jgi:hypothetical protein